MFHEASHPRNTNYAPCRNYCRSYRHASSESVHLMSLFARLAPQPADALLALIHQFRDDPRHNKIDLGVGVYKDERGSTPVMRAVKATERMLVARQMSKSYLGPEGDAGFVERLKPIVFGGERVSALGARLTGIQTPGGTGALRLACEIAMRGGDAPTIWVGEPTWPNHEPIMEASGLQIRTYRAFDASSQSLLFDNMRSALRGARSGDIVLLHGCCHNPTGADLDISQWRQIADLIAERGLLPLIDLAYQGLGQGLEEDAAGTRIVVDRVGTALLAYSCDKNFGLYRERTGALFAVTPDARTTNVIRSNLLSLARSIWSMPPDHGAAVVRLILESGELTQDWRAELDTMRHRLRDIRRRLAASHPSFVPFAAQHGMFSLLPLETDEVAALRSTQGIYMANSGRINIAGLTTANIEHFARVVGVSLRRCPPQP